MPEIRGRRSPEDIKRSMEMAKKMMARSKEKELIKDLRWARGVIIVLGCINFLLGLSKIFSDGYSQIDASIDIGIGAALIALYFWSKEKPYEAILAALILYGVSWLLIFLIDPISFFSGILFKIVIIGGLITGLRAANKVKKKPKQNEELLDDIS